MRTEARLPIDLEPLPPELRPLAQRHALEITILWGDAVLETVQVRERRPITLSADRTRSADLYADLELEAPSVELAVHRAADSIVRPPPGAKLLRASASGTAVFERAGDEVLLGLHERLAFAWGPLTFVVQHVRGEAELAVSESDWSFSRVLALSLMLHAFVVANALLAPGSERLLDQLQQRLQQHGGTIFVREARRVEPQKPSFGARPKNAEGQYGEKRLTRRETRPRPGGGERARIDRRRRDLDVARSSGLVGLFLGGAVARSNVLSGGMDGLNESLDGLHGSESGRAGGDDGLGSRGPGPGGGGHEGTVDIGALHSEAGGPLTALRGGLRRAQRIPGKRIVAEGLSRAEVGRVIRLNHARFRHCYERELPQHPDLAGKVSIHFTIAPNGMVAHAEVAESTLQQASVERCVAGVMRTLQFPAPRGGGVAIVTYPFVFSST